MIATQTWTDSVIMQVTLIVDQIQLVQALQVGIIIVSVHRNLLLYILEIKYVLIVPHNYSNLNLNLSRPAVARGTPAYLKVAS